MALLSILSALSAFPLIHAHMQMGNPSPFRDPHATNRPNEPKDYNILKPLKADGSDFSCKGYQWNTPWTTVATYEPGKTYQTELSGSATHGGGSCQLSFSFDGGINFKVIKSIEGGCPIAKQYNFTVPLELGKGLGNKRTTGLFAWTWYRDIGSEESSQLDARGVTTTNAAAQSALASYPNLFVANLASINDCVTKETTDVVFDNPGRSVDFGDEESGSAAPSFKKGECTGKGSKSAGSSTSSSSSAPPSSPQGSSSSGSSGQWQSSGQSSTSSGCNLGDGL
ncbi:hypothetical protein EK21DRAFT_52581 [Setomelanomma holmii]|uniref:Endoglucanase n=1 Tax=Setomelanomma holmii TaxID=210430 RepID=A0A9P4LT14_9PLEO|nr:hypothetical protein EK21DRAFT_52581 [Setomelanomma holmii]